MAGFNPGMHRGQRIGYVPCREMLHLTSLCREPRALKAAGLSNTWSSTKVEKRPWPPQLRVLCQGAVQGCGKDGAATGAVSLQVLTLCKSGRASSEALGVEQDRTRMVSAFMSWRNFALVLLAEHKPHFSPGFFCTLCPSATKKV